MPISGKYEHGELLLAPKSLRSRTTTVTWHLVCDLLEHALHHVYSLQCSPTLGQGNHGTPLPLTVRAWNEEETRTLFDGTKLVHVADSRIPFARIDPGAHIGVSLKEHNDLGRFMCPVDTKHQWVEEGLIQLVGNVCVV
eukprot:scaffold1401_cov330-Pavlova_lutheri.AAC.16